LFTTFTTTTMKVSKIAIKDFQQFKDFELDLTYPEGHPKAGQPLDKVCLIGQSGTGKTTILNLIKGLLDDIKKYAIVAKKDINPHISYEIKLVKNNFEEWFVKADTDLFHHKNNYFYAYGEGDLRNNSPIFEQYKKFETVLIFYPAESIEYINQKIEDSKIANPLNNILSQQDIQKYVEAEKAKIENQSIYDFKIENPIILWQKILLDIANYEDKMNFYSRLISKALLEDDTKTIDVLRTEFKEWQFLNPNPLKNIAKILNPIINKFYLEVNTKAEYKSSAEVKFIELSTLISNHAIPYSRLSTGTKQIILTATPLFQLNTKDAVILFDEPERSLFPDIQRTLINYYTELAPEAQFFFATHSPLIASQFEPCERFILTFDEETGFVKAHRGIAPEGDDANDLLSKDFATEVLTPKGVEKYQEFIRLRSEIRKETNPEKKEELSIKYFELANQYNFKLPNAN